VMVEAVAAGRSRNVRTTSSIPRIQAFAFCPICHGVAFDGKPAFALMGCGAAGRSPPVSCRSRLMKLIRCATVFVSMLWITLGVNAQELKVFTVDTLVAKNIEAKGGIDALHAVQSLRLKGKMLVNQGQIEFAYTQ